MTPLAQFICRQTLLPIKDRLPAWQDEEVAMYIRGFLLGARQFEVTAIEPLLNELFQGLKAAPNGNGQFRDLIQVNTFLPSPQTWLEFVARPLNDPVPLRFGLCLEQGNDGIILEAQAQRGAFQLIGALRPSSCTLEVHPHAISSAKEQNISPDLIGAAITQTALFLAIINSPKIVGRVSHAPHKGLARELRQRKLPIPDDWTEIKLQITKPRNIYDGEPHTDTVTGQRALHFCRKHIRICTSGKLAYVTGHWRGSPEIGTVQSRYAVTP